MPDDQSPRLLFVSTILLEAAGDPTERKKWSRMAEDFEVFVICFGEGGFGIHRRYDCRFFTVPGNWPLLFRVLAYYAVVPWVATYLTLARGTGTWIAQSPYEAGAVWLPKLLLSPLGCRLIVEAHGDWVRSFLELRSPPFLDSTRKLLEVYSSLILRVADGYRSISERTEELLLELGNRDRPMARFPGYINIETFLDCTIDDKAQNEENFLLYAGALTELKGVDFLLDVLAEIHRTDSSLSLCLCGKGPLEESLRERSRTLGLEQHVTFEGYVDTTYLKKRMLEAKLLLLPSRTEGFGRVLVEGLATYTPFVASKTGGPTEIARESEGGRLAEDSLEDWRETILELSGERKTRRRMGRSGRRYVEESFSTESYVEQYKHLIRQVQGS